MSRSVRLYIEGGSTGKVADNDFRRGWKKFLVGIHEIARSVGFSGLVIVRGKGRSNTFKQFKNHYNRFPEDLCVLLVDSETAVAQGSSVWDIVKNRQGDGWDKPAWATEEQLYLMVHFVESWLVADPPALESTFGRNFDASRLPTTNLETRSKQDILEALKKATRNCKRGAYSHGDAHFVIEHVRPEKVKTLSHGYRLFESMEELIRNS